jgi:hypothetical protein
MARTLTGFGVAQMADKPATMEHMMNLARCRFGLLASDQIQQAAAKYSAYLIVNRTESLIVFKILEGYSPSAGHDANWRLAALRAAELAPVPCFLLRTTMHSRGRSIMHESIEARRSLDQQH